MTDAVVPADAAGLRRAAELLRRESVCAFPTETVYGLGAHAFSAKAVAEIYRLKQRPSWNPLIVHVPSTEDARALAHEWPAAAETLAAHFWPGPLSIVVERAHHLPSNGAPPTIAIRVPAHPVALALLRECGLPLAAPSANRSESISPTTAAHVIRSLPDVPLVLDAGPCRYGIESTVVDVTVSPPRLLRPGALSLRALRDAIGPLQLPPSSMSADVRSPGLAHRHYAPRARLILGLPPTIPAGAGLLLHTKIQDLPMAHAEPLPDSASALGLPPTHVKLMTDNVSAPGLPAAHVGPLSDDLAAPGLPAAYIGPLSDGHAAPGLPAAHVGPLSDDLAAPGLPAAQVELLSDDPSEYAADLYAALHRLDDAGVTTIYAQPPPDDEDWLAVRDRLTRAAAT